jgi:hypothetical protein
MIQKSSQAIGNDGWAAMKDTAASESQAVQESMKIR